MHSSGDGCLQMQSKNLKYSCCNGKGPSPYLDRIQLSVLAEGTEEAFGSGLVPLSCLLTLFTNKTPSSPLAAFTGPD